MFYNDLFFVIKKTILKRGNHTLTCRSKKRPQSRYRRLGMLNGNPQAKAVIVKMRIVTPRKPNSARRPAAKFRLFNKRLNQRFTVAHIPGSGHTLRKYSTVLLRGGGARDLPGVYHSCIRGVFDLNGVINKRNRRSIYGVSWPDSKLKKLRRRYRSA